MAKPARRLPREGSGRRGRACHDDVRLQADQLLRERTYPIALIAVPPKVQADVGAIGPAQPASALCGAWSPAPMSAIHYAVDLVGVAWLLLGVNVIDALIKPAVSLLSG